MRRKVGPCLILALLLLLAHSALAAASTVVLAVEDMT